MPEDLIYRFRWQITTMLAGLILVGLGVLAYKSSLFNSPEVEIITEEDESTLIVEISGEVVSPGVYELASGSRINDALIAAGGFAENADLEWVQRSLNRASVVEDGQKIYIPSKDQHSPSAGATNSQGALGVQSHENSIENTQFQTININTATASRLEELWGIGPVTAQNLIDHRPYSSVKELLDKKILKSNVYERNKDILSVY